MRNPFPQRSDTGEAILPYPRERFHPAPTKLLRRVPIGRAAGLAVALAPMNAVDAGPVDPRHVAADAAWVVHFDVEACLASRFGSTILKAENPVLPAGPLAQIKERLGIDALTDVHDFTLYSTGPDPRHATVLITTSDRADGIPARLKEYEDLNYEQLADAAVPGDVTLHSYMWDGARWYMAILPARAASLDGADPARELSRRRIVVASDPRRAAAGAAVLTGAEPNLASSPAPELTLSPGTGSILYAQVARVPDQVREEGKSAVSVMAESGSFEFRESDGVLHMLGIMNVADEKEAESLTQIIQGALAMSKFSIISQPGMEALSPVFDRLTTTSSGATLTISWSFSSDELVRLGESVKRSVEEAAAAAAEEPEQPESDEPEPSSPD